MKKSKKNKIAQKQLESIKDMSSILNDPEINKKNQEKLAIDPSPRFNQNREDKRCIECSEVPLDYFIEMMRCHKEGNVDESITAKERPLIFYVS